MSQGSVVGPEISRTHVKLPRFMMNVIVSSLTCEEKVGSPVLIMSPSLLAVNAMADVGRDRMHEICSILPLLSSSVFSGRFPASSVTNALLRESLMFCIS